MLKKSLAGAIALAALIATGPVFAQTATAPSTTTTAAPPAAAPTTTAKPRAARKPSQRTLAYRALRGAGYTQIKGLKKVAGGATYTATATKDGKTGTVTVDPKTGSIQ